MTRRPHHSCDWCREPLSEVVYTVLLPSGIQALVGQCCAAQAALSMRNSPTPRIAARGRELTHLLPEQILLPPT
jgi:hypothetical protein